MKHVFMFNPGLDFHEDLHRIGVKEGLKGRKLQKAMESYAWNITVLKVKKNIAYNIAPNTTHSTSLHYIKSTDDCSER